MIALGFRAEPRDLNWAVVERKDDQQIAVIADSTWSAPKTYDEGKALSWFREKVMGLIDQQKPDRAAVRYPEPKGQRGKVIPKQLRLRLEGVVLQALEERGLSAATGALSSIGARLKSKTPKAYLERQEFRGLDLSARPKERQEAILVAISALGDSDGD
jgi:hypothetical protein